MLNCAGKNQQIHGVYLTFLFARVEALCNVCAKRRGEWKKDIISQLTPRTVPCWKNTDKSKWETDAWEIAKVFMGPGQGAFRAGAADTDPIGLLQLVLNCQLFTSCISNRQSFDDVSGHIVTFFEMLLQMLLEDMCTFMKTIVSELQLNSK